PYIEWEQLAKKIQNKTLIGFSDASALIAALWAKVQWNSIHGPMPQSDLWQVQGESGAIVLIKMLTNNLVAQPLIFKDSYNDKQNSLIKGVVFGGCLSVLSQLIGTPYFPKFHSETILFWEDVGETAAKIMRLVNQWQQAGCLENVTAIILGRFTKLDPSGDLTRQDEIELLVQQELASRLKLPIFICENLGHIVENHPIFVGKNAEIRNKRLTYVESFV
ncbi:MAG: LD-carboxypeptidase, partial [Oligoflexales bacterium]|nr:LD-carboxypeptidase [Oligoflexales bacterium]